MRYVELIDSIRDKAISIGLVNSFANGSPYEHWLKGNVNYGAVAVSMQGASQIDALTHYTLRLYYADRLLKDESNRDAVWDDGMNVLRELYTHLKENIEGVDVVGSTLNFNLFVQEFSDYLGGAYADIEIQMVSELTDCGLDAATEERTLTITENGTYDVFKYDHVNVEVPAVAASRVLVFRSDLKWYDATNGMEQVNAVDGVMDFSAYSGVADTNETQHSGIRGVNARQMIFPQGFKVYGFFADMLFYHTLRLTELDLSGLDVSSVYSFVSMFERCAAETIDLSDWGDNGVLGETGMVDLRCMFKNCKVKTLLLNRWDLRTFDYTSMFEGCTYLTDIYMEGCNDHTVSVIQEACRNAGINPTIHR